MDGFIGQIYYFGGNFAPRNFSYCNGALLPIQQNAALFAILGITYGGDARTNFALPDTRGRFIISEGQSTVDPYVFEAGTKGGTTSVTLSQSQMPSHTHAASLVLDEQACTLTTPQVGGTMGASPAGGPPSARIYSADTEPASPVVMSDQMISVGETGGTSPFSIIPPYLAIPAIICMFGEFPSKN